MKLKSILIIATFVISNYAMAQTFEKDSFKTNNGNDVVITFIKHGSLMITYEDKYIQIDPVGTFADYSTFPKADIILITHEHGDHLDKNAIETLTKENTLLVINKSSRDIIGKGKAIKNGEQRDLIDNITLEAVPAYNTTPGRAKFHPKHRDNGYIVSIEDLRIYIAGDTEDIPEMKDLKDIDIAFLPINQPYTMTVEQAVNAANMITPRVLYPYHFSNTNVKPLVGLLENTGIEVRLRKME